MNYFNQNWCKGVLAKMELSGSIAQEKRKFNYQNIVTNITVIWNVILWWLIHYMVSYPEGRNMNLYLPENLKICLRSNETSFDNYNLLCNLRPEKSVISEFWLSPFATNTKFLSIE